MTRRPVNRTAQAASLLRACVFAPASAYAALQFGEVGMGHRWLDDSPHPGEIRA